MPVTSPSKLGIFRTQLGISSRPGGVSLRGSKWSGLLIAISLLPLLRVKKAILLLLLIVLIIEDSRVVVC